MEKQELSSLEIGKNFSQQKATSFGEVSSDLETKEGQERDAGQCAPPCCSQLPLVPFWKLFPSYHLALRAKGMVYNCQVGRSRTSDLAEDNETGFNLL